MVKYLEIRSSQRFTLFQFSTSMDSGNMLQSPELQGTIFKCDSLNLPVLCNGWLTGDSQLLLWFPSYSTHLPLRYYAPLSSFALLECRHLNCTHNMLKDDSMFILQACVILRVIPFFLCNIILQKLGAVSQLHICIIFLCEMYVLSPVSCQWSFGSFLIFNYYKDH